MFSVIFTKDAGEETSDIDCNEFQNKAEAVEFFKSIQDDEYAYLIEGKVIAIK